VVRRASTRPGLPIQHPVDAGRAESVGARPCCDFQTPGKKVFADLLEFDRTDVRAIHVNRRRVEQILAKRPNAEVGIYPLYEALTVFLRRVCANIYFVLVLRHKGNIGHGMRDATTARIKTSSENGADVVSIPTKETKW
jgi:hypothetical protein